MTSIDDIESIAQKFRQAEEKVSAKRGGFYLFGLFERETRPGWFDLVASAPWLQTDRDGTEELVVLLREHLDLEDWRMIAAAFPLEPSADYVKWFTKRFHLEHQVEERYNAVFNGVPVSHAFLITANPSPTLVTQQPVAA